jgi:hypothetical protein
MTAKEIYKRFLLKINKNDTNEGINILPSLFVLNFNTEAVRWLGDKFTDDGDNWKLSHLDNLLEVDKVLNKATVYEDSVEFEFPENFYRYASSYSIVDKGNCKGQKVFNFEKTALGFNTVIADDFSGPQYDYRETPFQITQNKLRVYFDNFEIKKVHASYYRVPKQIDMAGYEKIDGSPSTDIDSDLTVEQIDEILNRMVIEVTGNYQDSERYQYAKERISTEP